MKKMMPGYLASEVRSHQKERVADFVATSHKINRLRVLASSNYFRQLTSFRRHTRAGWHSKDFNADNSEMSFRFNCRGQASIIP